MASSNSPLIVGIVSSCFDAIVGSFAKLILSSRNSSKYSRDVRSANQEILESLLQNIVRGSTPDRRICESLTNATSRDYSVAAHHMYGPKEVAEKLTKEIMDSPFLSSKMKEKFCNRVHSMTAILEDSDKETVRVQDEREYASSELNEYKEKINTCTSIAVGSGVAYVTMLFLVAVYFDLDSFQLALFLMPVCIAVATALVMGLLEWVGIQYRRQRKT